MSEHVERSIIIGLITSTEFCQKIKPIWNITLIESNVAKKLAEWCWEYYDKYGKAPSRDIEGIYYQKLKENKLPKDLFSEIEEEILPGLSKEYENKSFNLDYLVEETQKYLSSQHIKLLSNNIEALLSADKLMEAEKMVHEFQPLDNTIQGLNNYIVSTYQIREKKRPKTTVLISPWLIEGQTTIIYGNFGSGKSLLSLSIAYILGLKDYTSKESEIGGWQVKHPTGTLYIDGELGEQEMNDRVKQFEWIGKQHAKHKMKILSIPEYQLATQDSFLLSDRKNQLKVIQWLKKNPNYKLIILDSISTLFGLVEENDNSEWSNKINPFLRDLRVLGVACILLHHSGKNNKKGLRGASAMGAMAHNIFRLTDRLDKKQGEAWFGLTVEKQRASGYGVIPFSLNYIQDEYKTETHWEITSNYSKDTD